MPRFSPDDGILDTVAIDRALDGWRIPLTLPEVFEVVRRHVVEREGSLRSAAELLGLHPRELQRLFEQVDQQAFFGRTLRDLKRERERFDTPNALRCPSQRFKVSA